MRSLTSAPVLAGLVLVLAGAPTGADPPPVARGAGAIGAAALRSGELAARGARSSRGTLVPIRAESTIMAGGVKIAIGQVSMTLVELVVHDKRPRRVEVVGLGGGSFVFLTPPCLKIRVPMPPGFGPPLALRVEPCPGVVPTALR